jgi:hypothetical protein
VSGTEAEARAAWLHSADVRTALKLMPRSRTLEREVSCCAPCACASPSAAPGTGTGAARRGAAQRGAARGSAGQRGAARQRAPPTAAPPPPRTPQVLGALSRLASHGGSSLPHDAKCRLAVLSLPLGMRRLLAHAYFSRAFNAVASERLRRHGLAPAREGELVLTRRKLLRGRGGPGARRVRVRLLSATAHAPRAPTDRGASCPRPWAAYGRAPASQLAGWLVGRCW